GVDPERNPRAVVAPMLVGSIAGQVLGAAVSPGYEVSPDDAVLASTIGAWTAWQAIGWGYLGERRHGGNGWQSAGYGLTTAGAGALAAVALVPLVEVTPAESAMIASGGAW